jgi:hemerythrin
VQNRDKTIYNSIVEELLSFTHQHFSAEEQFLQEVRYKNREKHIGEHGKLDIDTT